VGAPLPNSQRQNRTNAPTCGAAASTGAGAGTGIGIIGAAEAGKILGTRGTSPCGFLSRFPIFESSTMG
jgi:hypothetical protein